MLEQLDSYFDECDERTLELKPQIESIKMLADFFHQIDDEKKLEDLRKSQEVKKFLIKRKKTLKPAKDQLPVDLPPTALEPALPKESSNVIIRIQKVYEPLSIRAEEKAVVASV